MPDRTAAEPASPPLTLLMLFALAGLLLSILAVVSDLDGDVVRLIAPRQETYLAYAWSISYFGDSTGWLVGSALIAIGFRLARPQGPVWRLAAFCFVAVAGAGILSNILKVIAGRPRPRWLLEGQWGFHFFAWPPGDLGFPSGHATIAGAVATCLALLWPRLTPLFALGAVLIAASRVFVGFHYLSDTIAGLTVGCIFTLALRNACLARGWWPARPWHLSRRPA